jgi:hypothetical protein
VRLLHRSGLTVERGSPTALPVRYVPKGHFFVTVGNASEYSVCGDGVTLARSLGPPQGGVGQM